MKKDLRKLVVIICLGFFSCTHNDSSDLSFYHCVEDGFCVKASEGEFSTLQDCEQACQTHQIATVTVFLYENCPIAQYMCGPLRDAYRYFCDTLNANILFRGFSPNSFSTPVSLADFTAKYDIPFSLEVDYDDVSGQPGFYTYLYNPVVTPEIFIERNGELIYRGMIDNSYQSLGQWAFPTENYLLNVLTQVVNEEDISYFETEAIGCFINY